MLQVPVVATQTLCLCVRAAVLYLRCVAGCVPVPRQVGGAVGPQPRQQRVVGVVENLLGVTLSLEVTEQ